MLPPHYAVANPFSHLVLTLVFRIPAPEVERLFGGFAALKLPTVYWAISPRAIQLVRGGSAGCCAERALGSMERRDFLEKDRPGRGPGGRDGNHGSRIPQPGGRAPKTGAGEDGQLRGRARSGPAGSHLRHQPGPGSALNAALDGIGGIGRFVKAGERVVVKPNVGWDRTPAQGANTNPALVSEMVRLCLAAGAAQVTVTDVSCNDPRRSFLRSGIREAAEICRRQGAASRRGGLRRRSTLAGES